MRTMRNWNGWRRLAVLVMGTAFFLEGCDPGVQATVENGIITTSNGLLTSIFQAVVQLAQEANNS